MKGFLRAGHFPTAWILLGPLAPFLREELGLSPTSIPLLGGGG